MIAAAFSQFRRRGAGVVLPGAAGVCNLLTSLATFTRSTLSTQGNASIEGGVLTIAQPATMYDTLVETGVNFSAARLYVSTVVAGHTGVGTGYDVFGPGPSVDAGNFIIATFSESTPGAGAFSIQTCKNGVNGFFGSVAGARPYALALALEGNIARAYRKTNPTAAWSLYLTQDISSVFNFATTANIANFRPGLTVATSGGPVWSFSAFCWDTASAAPA